MGKEPTAGFAFLKGATTFEDGSMLVLITGFAYLFDGTMLGTDGVLPNYRIPETVDDVPKFVLDQIKISIINENGK